MKIHSIDIKALFGVEHLSAQIDTPIVLFCGDNEAGKSSVANAVRLALTGTPSRVSLKKEYGQMVTDGNKKFSVSVNYGDGLVAGMDYPKGAAVHDDHPFLPYVLEPSSFADMKPDERRSLLFKLANLSASKEKVIERLQAKGCNMKKAESLIPLLRSGFPAAAKEAADRAKTAKGQWKGVTGETWGAKKAEEWEPETVELDQAALKDLNAKFDTARQRLDELLTQKGKAEQQAVARKNAVAKLEQQQALAATLDAKAEAMDAAIKALEEAGAKAEELAQSAGEKPAQAIPCPCCGVQLVMQKGELVEYKAPEYDEAAALKLADLRQNVIPDLERKAQKAAHEHSEAKNAQVALDNIEDLAEPDYDALAELQGRIDATKEAVNDLAEDIRAEQTKEQKFLQAQEAGEKAKSAQQDVVEWRELADAMSPDGIPGELMGEALKPFNDRLAQSAEDTGWKLVQVTQDPKADMEITAGGRPYHLLCESEKWRADAMLAEAISHMSGLKLLCLDRFDVLSVANRGVLINWLKMLSEEIEIDTALIFGTLKQCPPSSGSMTCYWLEGGAIQEEEKAA